MRKMKSPKELRKMVEEEGYELNENEARLLDLLEFHKTGKRTEKFKTTNKPKPPKQKYDKKLIKTLNATLDVGPVLPKPESVKAKESKSEVS